MNINELNYDKHYFTDGQIFNRVGMRFGWWFYYAKLSSIMACKSE